MEDVLHDLDIIKAAEELGLSLHNSKSENICHDATMQEILITALPGALVVSPESACLLETPLGDVSSIDACLDGKIQALTTMGACFFHLYAHNSLILLHHSFAVPKLRHLLHTAACFLSNCLEQYDSVLRSITSSVTNIPLVQDEVAWIQASLPVRLGGLGVHHALQVAPSAYLSSLASTADLVSAILPTSHQSLPVPSSDIALTM